MTSPQYEQVTAPVAATIHGLRRVAPEVMRGIALTIMLAIMAAAKAQEPEPPLPTFAELEKAGARIGEIHILNQDIFDTEDPEENNLLFRTANALHIQTQGYVIESALLFKSGDRVSVRLIDETERVLRSKRYLYDVRLRPVAYRDGVVDIEVATRDTWTLQLGISASRSGGTNSSGISLEEVNLLGTGTAVSFDRSNSIDRSSNTFEISNDRAFDGWTLLSYSRARNSDGNSDAASIIRPFYALDARWAAGVKASRNDRIESVYNAGSVVSEFRHKQDLAEVNGGWSLGRVDGWVRRYSVGADLQDDAFAPQPGRTAPAQLPSDEKLIVPFFRLEVLEDRFEKKQNRNQIGRPEFFALGLQSTLQIGRASTGLGSSRDAWLYSGTISRGFEPTIEETLLASAAISGQYADGHVERQQLGATSQYFLEQGRRWVLYAAIAGDTLTRPSPTQALLLGGDSGLRGYPLRYQSGQKRALFTIEERVHTDVYPFRLFRLGGAVFLDVGRAWGGDNVNTADPGWLANVGAGLRIFSVRAAFSTVVHIDVACPIDPKDHVQRVQFLVKTKSSF